MYTSINIYTLTNIYFKYIHICVFIYIYIINMYSTLLFWMWISAINRFARRVISGKCFSTSIQCWMSVSMCLQLPENKWIRSHRILFTSNRPWQQLMLGVMWKVFGQGLGEVGSSRVMCVRIRKQFSLWSNADSVTLQALTALASPWCWL